MKQLLKFGNLLKAKLYLLNLDATRVGTCRYSDSHSVKNVKYLGNC